MMICKRIRLQCVPIWDSLRQVRSNIVDRSMSKNTAAGAPAVCAAATHGLEGPCVTACGPPAGWSLQDIRLRGNRPPALDERHQRVNRAGRGFVTPARRSPDRWSKRMRMTIDAMTGPVARSCAAVLPETRRVASCAHYRDSRCSSSIRISRAGAALPHVQSTRLRSSSVVPGAKLCTSSPL